MQPLWFDRVRAEFVLGPDDEAILCAAEDAYKRWQELKERIDTDGIMVSDRFGHPGAHPLLGAERAARNALAELMAKLRLPKDDEHA